MPRLIHLVTAVFLLAVAGAAGTGIWYFAFRGRVDPMVRAERMLQSGDLRGAQMELRNALRDHPDQVRPHLVMAGVQLRMSDPTAAEKELRTALSLGADRWAVMPDLARTYAAQAHFQDLLDNVPAQAPTPQLTTMALDFRTSAQLGLKDLAAAAETVKAAETNLHTYPANDPAIPTATATVAMMAARLAAASNDLPAAEAHVDAALQADPKQFEALMMKQVMLAARRDQAGALAIIDRAIAVAPWSGPARLTRANLLLAANQDAKAKEDITAVLQLQPRNPAAQYLAAVLMVRAGENDQAATALDRLNAFAQVVPRIHYFQAVVATRLNRPAPAEDFAARYARAVPADPDGAFLLARAEIAVQRPDQALLALQKLPPEFRDGPRALDLMGTAYTMMARLPEASAAFERAASLAPDDATIAGHFGLIQAQTGGAATTDALDRLATLSTGQPATTQILVRAALTAGDLDRAATALQQLRKEVGDTETVAILTGSLAQARADLPAAETAFADAARRFPASVGATLNLAQIYILQGRAPEAATIVGAMLANNKANLALLTAYVRLEIAQNQFEPAIKALQASREALPGNAGLTMMLADVQVRSGDPKSAIALLQSSNDAGGARILKAALARAQAASNDLPAAIATLADMVRAYPTDLEVRRLQATILQQDKNPALIVTALQDAVRQFPGDHAFMWGLVALKGQSGGIDAALAEAAELRGNTANMPQAATLKGEALMAVKRYPEASQALLDEYRQTPNPAVLPVLIASYLQSNRPNDAATILQAAIKADPANLNALRLLSDIEIKAGNLDSAATLLERVLDKDRTDAAAINNLAWIYATRKDPRALPMARRAYALQPSADTADTLAWVMVRQGDARNALPILQQAAALRPNDPGVAYHLAVALDDTGKPEDAARLLRPITAQSQDFPEKADATTLLKKLAK